jgi:hypothetical protein
MPSTFQELLDSITGNKPKPKPYAGNFYNASYYDPPEDQIVFGTGLTGTGYGRTQSPEERQAALSFAAGGGGGGGVPGASYPSFGDLSAAYNQQQLRSGIVQNAALAGSAASPLLDYVNKMLASNEGIGQAAMDAGTRDITDRNTSARVNTITNLNERLGANGGAGSPAAAFAEGQINQGFASDLTRDLGQLNARNEAAQIENRGRLAALAASLAGQVDSNRLSGAQIVGNIQQPVFPGSAQAAGGSSGAAGTGGGSLVDSGAIISASALQSPAQMRMLEGNAKWRQQTGQAPQQQTTYGGGRFLGFSW